MLPSILGVASKEMRWNKQPIPYSVALQIGWNLPIDVVGAGVYGGIVKRDSEGRVLIGDEWPENNLAPPAHNPIHRTGPYLDYARLTADNRGYTSIAQLIMDGRASKLDALLESVPEANGARKRLANLVMTGGARPLHMCGMGRGGDTSELIKVLIRHGADVNAKDNYEMTPMERLSSNMVAGNDIMKAHGGVTGRRLPRGAPDWSSDAFVYSGPGE
mmetsp:Transcript_23039/g.74247  ORF Transcript_23039/g.74247 Transcript_23039/m.74247 type:complete len:217 (+) Transcript_23039:61-711(+)